MLNLFVLNKPVGITPLQAITKLKQLKNELSEVPLTYAGRLDPMAEGVLLVLGGEQIKQKEQYLGLPKTYDATIAFNFSTDTFDLLGLAKSGVNKIEPQQSEIAEALNGFVGETTLPLPPYSSVPVNGKPLWEWSRESRINEIEIPDRKTKIHSIQLFNFRQASAKDFLSSTKELILKVDGNFRQGEIIKTWERILTDSQENIHVVEIEVRCESGTYIRSLANELGKRLGGVSVLSALKRTAIGDFTLDNAISLD